MIRKISILLLTLCFISNNAYATVITVGNTVTSTGNWSPAYTSVVKGYAAGGTGTIDHIEVQTSNFGTNGKFGTFSASGNNLTSNAYVTIANYGSGSLTFDAPGDFTAFNVNTGDYIGQYNVAGRVAHPSGDTWYLSGDQFPCTNATFSAYATYELALYATGATSAAPATNLPPAAFAKGIANGFCRGMR